mmetsp:Transcript_10847/g.16149  ORF Transcript_10847/g.16149 Transcript_10847/m.16149 type:complete len:568 (-) Transcript_10847:106-1809(-)
MAKDHITSDDESTSSEYDDDINKEDEEDDFSNGEEESLRFYSLCCNIDGKDLVSFETLSAALEHDEHVHGFDLLTVLPSASDEEFYERAIVSINQCRQFFQGNSDRKGIKEYLLAFANKDIDEQFYKPVLSDDAYLMSLDDLQELKQRRESGNGGSESTEKLEASKETDTIQILSARVAALEEQLACAKECIANLTTEDMSEDEKTIFLKKKAKVDNNTYYFTSYSHYAIHETMLKDTVRTKAYEDAIMKNSATLFKDKVVLDIGCGTGVLSIFAAKAGAKKVIAVDGSEIIREARNIIDANGLSGTITCVRGMIETLLEKEELPLGPGEKVDVIVSEWMGYALFFETMLPSVMKARDAVMDRVGGTMFPNKASIHLEGASDTWLDYWDDVHGIDMTPMKHRIGTELLVEGSVEIVDKENVSTNRVELVGFDLNTCKDTDLDFEAHFELYPLLSDNGNVVNGGRVDKLVISFDIDFDLPNTNAVSFSTGCQSKPTHWKQTTLWFDPTLGVPIIKEDMILRGKFKMGRNKINHREMDFKVVWELGSVDGASGDFNCVKNGRIQSKLSA